MIKSNDTLDELIVTVCYLGKIKFAPGTFGSLAGLLILLLPEYMIWYTSLILAIILTIISYSPIKRFEKLNGDDHSSIVIDEVIGMLIVFSNPFMIISPVWIVIAFILFRIFDILKPYPISKLNEQKGAFFVLADDILAGAFALIILHIFQLGYRILPFFLSFLKII
jgi:phosphatidylglycerophosphatase A